jgi:hypothetical protein
MKYSPVMSYSVARGGAGSMMPKMVEQGRFRRVSKDRHPGKKLNYEVQMKRIVY